MSRARGRHGTGRAPELTPEQIQEFGIDEREIPSGIAHNDKNPVVQHEKPKVAEPLAEFRGMMAHGVPPEGNHYQRDPRLTGQVGRVHVKPVDIPESPVPVPVYIVEESGGSRALMHTATKHFAAPVIGTEPAQICGQDTKRRSVRILNEGIAGTAAVAGGASTTTEGSVTSPAAGATITSQALAAGTYTVSWSVQLSGTLAAADANNFGLYNGATLVATSLNTATAGTYPQPTVTVVIPGGGATLAIKAIALGTVGAVYTAQLTQTLQPVAAIPATAKGCRFGQLNDLAWDSQNNAIVGGALLPNSMTSYLEVRTQGPLYVVSLDSNQPVIDVIIETEIAGAA